MIPHTARPPLLEKTVTVIPHYARSNAAPRRAAGGGPGGKGSRGWKIWEGVEGMHTARVFSYYSFPCLISSSVVETENFTFKYATAFYLSPSYDSAPRLREKNSYESLHLSHLALRARLEKFGKSPSPNDDPFHPRPISRLAFVRRVGYHRHRNARFGSRSNVTT